MRLCSDLPLPTTGARTPATTASGGWSWRRRPWRGSSTSSRSSTTTATPSACCDPANPHRAPGAFGEKSVLLLPGYAPPRWLEAEGVPGRTEELAVRGRGLGAEVRMRIWSPADADPAEPLPLLVAHDGPEYDELAGLTRFAARRHRRGPAAAAPGRAARAGRARRVVLRLGALRRRAGPRRPARDRRGGRGPGRPGRHGREPRRAGDAARAAAPSADVRRAVPAVGQLLHAALRRPRVALPALPADRALRAARRCARGTGRSRAGRADLRIRGGERPATTG